MTLSEIAELCAHFRDVLGEFPVADNEILADAVMARLDREHRIALASEWVGMGGSPEHGLSINARAFVSQFIRAMGIDSDED